MNDDDEWRKDVLRRLEGEHGWAVWIRIEDDTTVGAVCMHELCDTSWFVAGHVPALQEICPRLSRHPN